jgi:protein-disulfide isomerase
MPPETQEPEAQIEQHPEKKAPVMTIPTAIILGAVIIGLAIIFTLKPKSVSNTDTEPQQNETPTEVPAGVAMVRDNDYTRGNPKAPVVVIEYSDSDCPFCQRFHETMKTILSEYGDSVGWVYRFYPLSIHPNAYTEALALTCVGELGGNTAFWNYLDKVMSVTLNPDPKSNEALKTYASQEGVSASMLEACLKNKSSTAKADAESAEAQRIGAQGTPFSVVVNVKTGEQVVVPGAYPIEYMRQTIDSLLK